MISWTSTSHFVSRRGQNLHAHTSAPAFLKSWLCPCLRLRFYVCMYVCMHVCMSVTDVGAVSISQCACTCLQSHHVRGGVLAGLTVQRGPWDYNQHVLMEPTFIFQAKTAASFTLNARQPRNAQSVDQRKIQLNTDLHLSHAQQRRTTESADQWDVWLGICGRLLNSVT